MSAVSAAAETGSQNEPQTPSLKEKVLEVPAGSVVQVQLQTKARLRGQIGPITDDGFTVKTVNGNSIEDKKVSFAEVKSIKRVGQTEASPSQADPVRPAGLKQQLTLLRAGSIVEVKLINKQKIRGRLGLVSDSGFEVQHARDNHVVTESLAFDAVRSVKETGKGMHFAWKVLIGTGIVFAVLVVIGAVMCATSGCNS
jgi:hypothetical protein